MNEIELWYAISVTVRPTASEAIEFAFNNLNSLGTEIDSLRKNKDENLRVVGYFDQEIDSQLLRQELVESLRIYGFAETEILQTESKEVENQDWLAEWKKHWKPTETERFIVAPSWETVEESEKLVIRIEPNMAFGTGTHETTRLCLKAIESHYKKGDSFFDVGTGTGILAIAVSKLSGKTRAEITACDVDRDSVKIAKENARLNESSEIEFYEGSISSDTPSHDFVCANMTADIILSILTLLVSKATGILVLSGILIEQQGEIIRALEELEVKTSYVETDGEWTSVTITK